MDNKFYNKEQWHEIAKEIIVNIISFSSEEFVPNKKIREITKTTLNRVWKKKAQWNTTDDRTMGYILQDMVNDKMIILKEELGRKFYRLPESEETYSEEGVEQHKTGG